MGEPITIAFPERLGKYGALDFVRERLGVEVDLDSKNKCQRIGKYEFVIMYTRMVPLAVERGILTGITGFDWYKDYMIGLGLDDYESENRLGIVRPLEFGKAEIVAFKKKNSIINPDSTRIVSPYRNLAIDYAMRYISINYARYCRFYKGRGRKFEDSGLTCLPGETEGWIKAGLADIGIDCKNSGQTIENTGLERINKILDSKAVIISKKKDIDKVKEIWGLI